MNKDKAHPVYLLQAQPQNARCLVRAFLDISRKIMRCDCLLFILVAISLLIFVIPHALATTDAALQQKPERLTFTNFSKPVTLTNQGEYYSVADSEEKVILSNKLILKTRVSVNKEDLLAYKQFVTEVQSLFFAPQFRYFCVKIKSPGLLAQAMTVLKNMQGVMLVQPDLLQVRSKMQVISKITETVDGAHQLEREFSNYYLDYLKTIGISALQAETKGEGVNLAVIDDGFALNHPALKDKTPLFAYDLDSYQLSSEAVSKGGKHGSKIASILFAKPVTELAGGIAPQANFIALRHTDTWTSKIILGFQLANLAHADIINCSWRSRWLTEPVADVINYLAESGRNGKGTVIVFAAGNDGKKIIDSTTEAALSSALVVSAHNYQFKPMKISSFGPSVDMAAFGGPARVALSDGKYGWFGGTSLSAAIVSGLTALLLSRRPKLTAEQVQLILQQHLPAQKISGAKTTIAQRTDKA